MEYLNLSAEIIESDHFEKSMVKLQKGVIAEATLNAEELLTVQ